MLLSSFVTYWWIIASFAPFGMAVLGGMVLWYRRGSLRPYRAWWFKAAIVLFLIEYLWQPYYLKANESFAGKPPAEGLWSAEGTWHPMLASSSNRERWALNAIVDSLALGCLFWAAMGAAPPAPGSDDEPPVFRSDDCTAEPNSMSTSSV